MEDQVQKTASHLLEHASTTQGVAPHAVARALWLSEESFATVLMLMALDTYGLEFLKWHPGAAKMQIEQDFGLELPKLSFDKVMAIATIIGTNYFVKSGERFIKLCNILSGDDFQPDEFEPADAGEILWGITEALLWWPLDDDKDDTEFSPEVLGYIRETLRREGIAHPPDVLRLGIDPSAAGRIDEAFDDDPEMYSAVWKAQQGKSEDLTTMLKSNLGEMAQQLQLLHLENGTVEEIISQILKIAGQLPVAQEAPTVI